MIGCVGAMYYLYKSSTDEDWLYFVLIIAFYCFFKVGDGYYDENGNRITTQESVSLNWDDENV
jgi:hypothetical protein